MNSKTEQNVVIDWGDYSYTVLRSAPQTPSNLIIENLSDSNKTTVHYSDISVDKEYDVTIAHRYYSDGKYIVKIWGNTYWGLRSIQSNYNIISRIFDRDLPINPCCINLCKIAASSLKLQKVLVPTYYQGFAQQQNLSSMFDNCKNLVSAMGFEKYPFPFHVTAPASIFSNCTNLAECDLRIAQSSNRKSSHNTSFYSGCSNLAVDVLSLLPAEGFSGRRIPMTKVFMNCSKLYCSNYDTLASILWEDNSKIWEATSECFAGCSDELRSHIPETWGGTRWLPFIGRSFTIRNSDDIYDILREAAELVHLEHYSLDTDDDVRDTMQIMMDNAGVEHDLDTDDDVLEAMELLLKRFGATSVTIIS